MRHGHGLRKLNRTSSHRQAMLRNMTNSLLRHESIATTLPKAKELRRVVEPMITLGKKPSLANRRLAFNRLRDREMVTKLFAELGPRYVKRGIATTIHRHTSSKFGRLTTFHLFQKRERIQNSAGILTRNLHTLT